MRNSLFLLLLLVAGCASAKPIRFATFNAALSKDAPGTLLATMRAPDDPQARAVAEIIQRVRPDVLLLQEFDHGGDYDPDGEALTLFQQNYLGVAQNGGEPIRYPHIYLAPSNTGLPTGVDLNGDGLVAPCSGAEVGTDAYAADCHGWGRFPGQYAFVILSKYPIDRANIRTFQTLLWKDLPGNHLPADHYSEAAKNVLRLSSKNHVDVPIRVGDKTVHVLAAHPTPPTFDGSDERNGRRNFDEITLLSRQILAPFESVRHLSDGGTAPNLAGPYFVVMGDLNADPNDGDSLAGAVNQLLDDPRVQTRVTPKSIGGPAVAARQRGANAAHRTDPATDTADWDDDPRTGSGNLRVDYVLPSSNVGVSADSFGGVFWPAPDSPLYSGRLRPRPFRLETVERASDHRLVWLDVVPK